MKFAVVAHRRSRDERGARRRSGEPWVSDAALPRPATALPSARARRRRARAARRARGSRRHRERHRELERLAAGGVDVLNPPGSLVAAHDKLLTARASAARRRAAPAHGPRRAGAAAAAPELPLVLKPRFGSWGRDVELCSTADELDDELDRLRFKPWFREHGVLAQELVAAAGWDLRLVVAGGRSSARRAGSRAPGEWRTNVALGAPRRAGGAAAARPALALVGGGGDRRRPRRASTSCRRRTVASSCSS